MPVIRLLPETANKAWRALIKKRGLLTPQLGKRFTDAYRLRCDAHYDATGVGVKETRRIVRDAGTFVITIEEVTGK